MATETELRERQKRDRPGERTVVAGQDIRKGAECYIAPDGKAYLASDRLPWGAASSAATAGGLVTLRRHDFILLPFSGAPDLENLEQRQDRDRREQELLLLALFLGKLRDDGSRTGGLMDVARNRADSALSLGADPFAAVADVLAGNVMLRMPPAWPKVAARLREADVAGYRRTVRVIGNAAEVDGYVPVTDHGAVARQVVARLLQYVQSRLSQGIRQAAVQGISVRRAVREAFEGGGLVVSGTNKAWYAETTAEVLIGFAYQGGAYVGWHRPGLEDALLGFEYVTVHDDRRTIICKAYDGVKLPTSDVWWEYHWPLNHWGCRSWCKPLFKAFTPTVNPPWVPAPTPGFGRAPIRYVSSFVAA